MRWALGGVAGVALALAALVGVLVLAVANTAPAAAGALGAVGQTAARYEARVACGASEVGALRSAESCAAAAGPLDDNRDQPRTARIRALLQERYGPLQIGGYRPSSRGAGHMEGRALDVTTGTDRLLGWQIVAFLQINADELGVEYLIFEQQIWHPGGTKWRRMADRGSLTQNHYDHPHIEVLPG